MRPEVHYNRRWRKAVLGGILTAVTSAGYMAVPAVSGGWITPGRSWILGMGTFGVLFMVRAPRLKSWPTLRVGAILGTLFMVGLMLGLVAEYASIGAVLGFVGGLASTMGGLLALCMVIDPWTGVQNFDKDGDDDNRGKRVRGEARVSTKRMGAAREA